MRMFRAWLQLEQINDIDKSDPEVREAFPEECGRSQSFLGSDVAGCGKDDIEFLTFIITGPIPDANAFCAVGNCGIHVEILQMLLFVRDNDVDIVFGSQAMIRYGQQAVGIRGQIDARDRGALVEYYVQESRVLVREAV